MKRKCIFCKKDIQEGELFHNTDECKKLQDEMRNFIFKEDRVTVGMATCGISAGAKETFRMLKKAKLNMPIEKVGCSGMCFNEPIVTVRQNGRFSIYGNIIHNRPKELIHATKDGNKHEDCFLGHDLKEIEFFKKQKRIIMRRCGQNSPLNLKQYLVTEGFEGLQKAINLTPKQVIEEIKKAGLRGRGGAGFPTWLKWKFLSEKEGEKYLVVNADEGDPGAFMNRTLMESDPFQILEGVIIASYATKANKGIIYCRAEYPLALKTLKEAIRILYNNNFLGKEILGKKGFDFDIEIRMGAGAFVCGEETALIESIEGERGHPRPRPPYPAERGVFDKPTNINNVETYAHVSNILRLCAKEYQNIGSKNNNGTKCVCLTGKIKQAGVAEVELGIQLDELIYDIGGGIKNNKKFKAIQSGGPSGGCIVEEDLNTPLDYDHIPKLGAIMGSGGLVIINEDDCMVDLAKFFLKFTTRESCGKCTPCREGTKRMLELVEDISKGKGKEEHIEQLVKLGKVIKDTALCGLGQAAPNPVLSTIKHFKDEYLMHIKEKRCPTHKCIDLMKFVISTRCKGCSNCEKHCPVGAISGTPGDKYVIDQTKCIKCGNCKRVCTFKAIDKI